jgi:osmotically-inducible protein OsmY
LGSSGFGSGGFGSGGLGSSGFGSGGLGSSGLGGSGFGTSGQGGSGFGQNSLGNNQQGGQNFVGRDSGDMASVFNQLGRNSNQFFQQLNRSMGGGRNQQGNSQQDNAALLVRVRLDVAFDHPRSQPTVVATAVRGRLETVLAGRSIVAPEVEMNGDTVVLRGVAPSESQRLMIEKLVSLEPGVADVDNQMTVATEQSANERAATESSASPPLPPQSDN